MICLAVCIAAMNIASASSVVVVFAPGCKYMSYNYHEIAKELLSPFFDKIWIGPQVDALYEQYSPRARKHFDEGFAREHGYDFLIQIYNSAPSEWKATHTNPHNGIQNDLIMGGINTIMVTANTTGEDGEDYYSLGAGFTSNHGHWRVASKTTWSIYDESFVNNMLYLIDKHMDYWLRCPGFEIPEPKVEEPTLPYELTHNPDFNPDLLPNQDKQKKMTSDELKDIWVMPGTKKEAD